MKKTKAFLGGTCNGSAWRQSFIPMIEGKVDYFDPVVPDWNEAAYQRELFERETCDFVVYTITPAMLGVYSIAEVVDDSNKRPQKSVLVILDEDDGKGWDARVRKSLTAVAKMVKDNGAQAFDSLEEAAQFLIAAAGDDSHVE